MQLLRRPQLVLWIDLLLLAIARIGVLWAFPLRLFRRWPELIRADWLGVARRTRIFRHKDRLIVL
eukprot:1374685-Pyramimonas_sp.AAC.2